MPQSLPASPDEHMNSSMSMKLYNNYLLKRSIQLVITLSLFSLLICLSTINSNPFFFSSFCTHTLERKYMFLICNAILAFLSTRKTTSTTSSSASEVDSVVKECDHQDAAMFEGGTSEEETEESGELGEGDEDGGSNDGEEVGDEVEEEDKEEEKGSWEMEAEEEEGGGKSSEEEMMELNRKIEDFIRKMKQEMRIESQQPLVAAV
ncbi:hypothetical protein LINGRAHAP2_LOCUS16641 [Linum grandiflorum]